MKRRVLTLSEMLKKYGSKLNVNDYGAILKGDEAYAFGPEMFDYLGQDIELDYRSRYEHFVFEEWMLEPLPEEKPKKTIKVYKWFILSSNPTDHSYGYEDAQYWPDEESAKMRYVRSTIVKRLDYTEQEIEVEE